jgi:hypothetical protein
MVVDGLLYKSPRKPDLYILNTDAKDDLSLKYRIKLDHDITDDHHWFVKRNPNLLKIAILLYIKNTAGKVTKSDVVNNLTSDIISADSKFSNFDTCTNKAIITAINEMSLGTISNPGKKLLHFKGRSKHPQRNDVLEIPDVVDYLIDDLNLMYFASEK